MLVSEVSKMKNRQYIYIAEESENDDSITPKWKNMNFLEKIVFKILNPIREEIEKSIKSGLKKLREENELLKGQVLELTEKINGLMTDIEKYEKKTNTLMAEYNTKIASSDSKYKAGIDVLYKLNLKFNQNVPTFGRAQKLETLQMLVNYLYHPEESIREAILVSSQDDEKTISILSDIDKFNSNFKTDLVGYLKKSGKTWEDCVSFPSDVHYDPQIMTPYNDIEIESGTPIYVVSLGLHLPNSNSDEQLPCVFVRKNNSL